MLECPFDHCGKTFTRKANLDGHINAHRGIQPYQCSHCSVRFTRRNEQRVHEREQHSTDHITQSYQCYGCGVVFPRKTTLIRHQGAGSSSMKCMRTTTKAAIDRTTTCSAPLVVGNTIKTAVMCDVLTDHIPATDAFYDWTYIGFSTAIDSYKSLYHLYSYQTRRSRHQFLFRVAQNYDTVIRMAATIFTRAPLQVVTPILLFLYALESARRNERGFEMLRPIVEAMSEQKVRRKDLSRFPPEAVYFPQLIQASESFLAISDELALIPHDHQETWTCVFHLFASMMTSLFSTWARQCTERGLDSQSASASALHQGFASLKHRSNPAFIGCVLKHCEQSELESHIQSFREFTDL